jgi:hypothetical protein
VGVRRAATDGSGTIARLTRLVAALFATLLLAPAASSAPSGGFTSMRYAYSLLLPLGWTDESTPGSWDGGLASTNAGVDVFRDTNDRSVLLTAAERPTAASRAVFHAEVARGALVSCRGRLVGGTTMLRFGGASSKLTSYSCADGTYLTLVTLAKDGRGYAFAWASHAARARADRVELEGILDSFEFS